MPSEIAAPLQHANSRSPKLPSEASLTPPPLEPVHIENIGSFERETISEPTRQLLCDFAAGDPSRPLTSADVDWEEVFQAVCRNGLVGLVHTYLRAHPGTAYPPQAFRRRIAWAQLVAGGTLARGREGIKLVLSRLAEAGIECLVLKGPALAQLVYPDPSARWYGDLDVHVREADLPAVHRVLREAGLVVVDGGDEQGPPRLIPQAPGAEWHYWAADSQLMVELHGDDLLHSGLVPRNYDGLWKRAIDVEVYGVRVKALSLEDQIATLAAHVHYHGYTRLNWLSDIAFIVRDHGAKVDWQRLIEIVRFEEVQVPVYYTLRLLDRLLGVRAPEAVLHAIEPDAFRRRLHEHFMPEDGLASLEPMPRPDFSFYFLPLFQRLLPDLLVMGRRREKLYFLARVFVPTPAWLRHYYGLRDDAALADHYALHPLKLSWHYAVSIGKTVSRAIRGRPAENGGDSRWWSAGPGIPGWESAGGHAH